MALGKVEVIGMNLGQGALPEVERTFCFIGQSKDSSNNGKLFPITPQTDIDDLFGEESNLGKNLKAAIQNANSSNFFAYAIPSEDSVFSNFSNLLMPLLEAPTDLNVEAVVICNACTEVEPAEAFVADVAARFCKFISVFLTTEEISESETWDTYITKLKGFVTGKVCPHVSVVPNLHGNNTGVVAGRLCNPAVTIGDSPMRVATGALVGLGEMTQDSAGKDLTSAHLADMANARLSVPQTYPSYPGMYWGDMPMLDAPGGDFQVYEYLRCVQAAMRRVYILAVKKVADRTLNSTSASIAIHQTYFARPLRDLSKNVIIAGIEFPGAIQPPKEGDVMIQWKSLTEVAISLLIAPVACPKKITCYLALDLNRL